MIKNLEDYMSEFDNSSEFNDFVFEEFSAKTNEYSYFNDADIKKAIEDAVTKLTAAASSPKASPKTSPKTSPKASPKTSPKLSPTVPVPVVAAAADDDDADDDAVIIPTGKPPTTAAELLNFMSVTGKKTYEKTTHSMHFLVGLDEYEIIDALAILAHKHIHPYIDIQALHTTLLFRDDDGNKVTQKTVGAIIKKIHAEPSTVADIVTLSDFMSRNGKLTYAKPAHPLHILADMDDAGVSDVMTQLAVKNIYPHIVNNAGFEALTFKDKQGNRIFQHVISELIAAMKKAAAP